MAKDKPPIDALEENLKRTEQEMTARLRLECLKLAHNNADGPTEIMARADKYLEWVMNNAK